MYHKIARFYPSHRQIHPQFRQIHPHLRQIHSSYHPCYWYSPLSYQNTHLQIFCFISIYVDWIDVSRSTNMDIIIGVTPAIQTLIIFMIGALIASTMLILHKCTLKLIITLQCCILAPRSLFSPAYVRFWTTVRHLLATVRHFLVLWPCPQMNTLHPPPSTPWYGPKVILSRKWKLKKNK